MSFSIPEKLLYITLLLFTVLQIILVSVYKDTVNECNPLPLLLNKEKDPSNYALMESLLIQQVLFLVSLLFFIRIRIIYLNKEEISESTYKQFRIRILIQYVIGFLFVCAILFFVFYPISCYPTFLAILFTFVLLVQFLFYVINFKHIPFLNRKILEEIYTREQNPLTRIIHVN